MTGTPDPATAALEEIKGRGYRNGATGATCARLSDAAAEDVTRLVAAVEAGTRLADGWEKETERLDTLAGSTEDPLARAAVSMRAQAFEQCARELREAITSALTSTQSPVETVETPPTRQEAPDGR